MEEEILDEIKEELTKNGLPSENKIGVGFSYLRTLPFCNDNGHAVTPVCVKNSLGTMAFSKFDFNHETENVVGGVLGSKIYNDSDEVVPETPMRLLGYGLLYKDRLEDNWIDTERLTDYSTSFHIEFKEYDFWHKDQIVLKKDAPEEWIMNVKAMIEGYPYYWEGERVNLILGGVGKDAKVNFFANSLLTIPPGDNQSGILLAVASRNQIAIFANKNKGGQQVKTYTEEEYKQAIAAKENEAKDFKDKFEKAEASLVEKDERITSLEAEVNEWKEKHNAEANKVSEYVLKDRKTALASKGYPEDLIAKKENFLKSATDEEFNDFVEEFEALAKTLKPKEEAKASSVNIGSAFNLTGGFNAETDGDLSLV